MLLLVAEKRPALPTRGLLQPERQRGETLRIKKKQLREEVRGHLNNQSI
jgi:hypothetical protein